MASECPDSCCTEWEICIDPETEKYYRTLPGIFGEKVRSHITVDKDGDVCFKLVDGRCPFLNAENLCDIHIKCGEEHTSSVCRQYPLFIDEYDGFAEKCPSVSCPAACRLIFAEHTGDEIYPIPEYNGDDDLLLMLIKGRAKAIEMTSLMPFDECAARIFSMCCDMQDIYDGFSPGTVEYDFSSAVVSDAYLQYNITDDEKFVALKEKYLAFLYSSTEILTDEWRLMLKKVQEPPSVLLYSQPKQSDMSKAFGYFVYRYMLQPVNDEDIVRWAVFCILSVSTCAEISHRCGIDFSETVRIYSKEIEHDTVNVEAAVAFITEHLPAIF